jgi:DNA replicative helicase MCM subunit Mcm2 (Cdc46/Mcm family)
MSTHDLATIYVDFEHMATYDYLLADAVKDNHYRFEPFLSKAVQNFVRKVFPQALSHHSPPLRSTQPMWLTTTSAIESSKSASSTSLKHVRSEICAQSGSDSCQQ